MSACVNLQLFQYALRLSFWVVVTPDNVLKDSLQLLNTLQHVHVIDAASAAYRLMH